MSTSQRTPFLSEIESGKPIPLGKLAYFRERFRDRLYELVVSEFLKQERAGGLSKAEVARRIGRKPEQITRWLGAPGNWTLETVSDLLLAICKSELNFSLAPLQSRPQADFQGAEWIKTPSMIDPMEPKTTHGSFILDPRPIRASVGSS